MNPPQIPTGTPPKLNAPLIAAFRWSKSEFMTAQRLAIRHTPARNIFWITNVIGTMILLSGGLNLYQRQWGAFVFTVFVALFFFCMPLFSRRTAAKLYAQKPDRDMDVTMEISDDGIHSTTPLASTQAKWALFQKVIRAKEGFLLCPSGRTFHWVPISSFRDPSDAERFAQLVNSHVSEYRQIG